MLNKIKEMRYFLSKIFFMGLLVITASPSVSYNVYGGVSETMTQEDVLKLIDRINRQHYNIASLGKTNVLMRCKSGFINSLANQAKDGALAKDLKGADFLVEWKKGRGFTIKVENMPSRDSNEIANQGVMQILSGTKDMMLGSFQIISFTFNGLYPDDVTQKLSAAKKNEYTVLSLLDLSKGTAEKFYFNNDYRLIKSELLQGEKVVSETNFEFMKQKQTFYLTKVRVFFPQNRTGMVLNVKYKDFSGVLIPASFHGATITGSKEQVLPQSIFQVIGADVKMQ